MKELARWPVLLAASILLAAALGVDLAAGSTAQGIVVALLALAAACLGAFLYAEGARHREWWHRHDRADDDDRPRV